MRKVRIFLMIIATALLFISCEDNRRQGFMDDTIYLMKNGVQKVNIKSGAPATYSIWATKAGYMKQTATVKYAVDESLLEGTSYTLMPTDCYSAAAWTFEVKEVGGFAKFDIVFNPDKILALEDGSKAALPLRISADGVEVVEGKDNAIIVVSVVDAE
ncbi:MAG: DUF1735 domain-containing protein [Candidatus Cryptobacteroides sp.]